MSINTEIQRLNQAKEAIRQAIEAKGIQVPYNESLSNYWQYIEQIQPQPEPTEQPANEIWYSTTDGQPIELEEESLEAYKAYDIQGLGITLISNTYENGKGVLKYSGDIAQLGASTYTQYEEEGIMQPLAYQDRLETVSFPDGIRTLGLYALINDEALTEVKLPQNLEVLCAEALEYCTSLNYLDIPETLHTIGYYALDNIPGAIEFHSVNVPQYVNDEGEPDTPVLGFLGENLTAIYVPAESVNAYKEAWQPVADIIQADGPVPTDQPANEIWYESTEQLQLNEDGITWGDEAQTINRSIVSHTFADGKGVITFDGDVVGLSDLDYGGSVFTNYEIYTEATPAPATKISLPASIRYIGGDSFFHYDNLEEIAGFENVVSMDEAALEDCGLYDLPALDNCDTIPDMCMQFWLRMEAMSIPENITHIGYQAFAENTNLVNVYCYPTVPPTTNGWEEDPWEGFVNCDALEHIYVPAGSVEAYKTAEGWSQYADRIQAIPE